MATVARPLPTLPNATLLEACDHPELFGITLTPKQRELLEEVERGNLLHVWALGRRSGKTLLGALIGLWFCLLRDDLAGAAYVRRRERRYCVAVATNLRQARLFVHAAHSIVEGSPLLAGMLESVTEDDISFKNRTTLAALPCTSRGGRGLSVMALLLDECAHMLDTDGNQAAGPIYRSLAPSVAQFGADARVIVASSPYGTDGFFADLFESVARGELPDAVCAQFGTTMMRPNFDMAALLQEQRRDPDGFRAEYEAQFVPPGGSFMDANRIADAVARKRELSPGQVTAPVAAIDLAFRRDASALVIAGRDRDDPLRLRLVLARSWTPKPGLPLSPTAVIGEVADLCRRHGVGHVFTDQHYSETAREGLGRRGFQVTVVSTNAESKSTAFADLKGRIYEGGLELYEHDDLLAELRRIETVSTPGAASVRIRRLGSSHGDLATALALACSRFRSRPRGRSTSHVPRGRIDTPLRDPYGAPSPPLAAGDRIGGIPDGLRTWRVLNARRRRPSVEAPASPPDTVEAVQVDGLQARVRRDRGATPADNRRLLEQRGAASDGQTHHGALASAGSGWSRAFTGGVA
jgi:hypothetical protein